MENTQNKPKNLISPLGAQVAKTNLTILLIAVGVLLVILCFYYWKIALPVMAAVLLTYGYFRLLYIPVYFRNARCALTGRFVILKKGVFYQKKTVMPLSRVQYCVIRQDVVQKVFGVCTVRIMMAGSAQRLRPIAMEDACRIRDAVNSFTKRKGAG